jgi:hypothetical protein
MNFTKPCSESELSELMNSDPIALASALESYLLEQVSETSSYDFIANKSLLKIYQCYPDLLKVESVQQLLMLALMKLPSTNFMALTYLLPSKLLSVNSQLKVFVTFAGLLENAKFIEFWSEYSQNKALVTSPTFEKSIRQFILETISLTFRDLPLATLGAYLGYTESELSAFLSSSSDLFEVRYSLDLSSLLRHSFFCPQVNGSQVTIVPSSNVTKVPSLEGGVRVEEVFRLMDVIRATA